MNTSTISIDPTQTRPDRDAGSSRLAPQGRRALLIWVNVLGGAAVLGSYVHGLVSNPTLREGLWGGVPAELRGLYTASMLLAAAGYLLMTHYAVFHIAARRVRIAGRPATAWMTPAYVAVLVPSALWLPLTFEMLHQPTPTLWLLVRVDLALVALGSLALLGLTAAARPPGGRVARTLALAGGAAFCFQTVVLDAIVWTNRFPF